MTLTLSILQLGGLNAFQISSKKFPGMSHGFLLIMFPFPHPTILFHLFALKISKHLGPLVPSPFPGKLRMVFALNAGFVFTQH